MRISRRLFQHKPKQGIFYGWYIAFAGANSNWLVLGLSLFGFGVFFEPLRLEMGWSAAVVAAGFSVRSAESGMLAPFAGYLIDRLGSRRMAIIGVTILGCGLIWFSQVHHLWEYFLSSTVIALGQSMGAVAPYQAAIMNWFVKKRGRAIGVLQAGNGLGYFTTPFVAALLVAVGWRDALIVIGMLIIFLGAPLAMVIRQRPEPYGYLPDGARMEEADSARSRASGYGGTGVDTVFAATGMSVPEALRTPAFYLFALANGSMGAGLITWITLQVPALQNQGFSLQTTGILVGIYGGLQVVFRLGAGLLGDSIGRRKVYLASFFFMGLGFWIFSMLSPANSWMLPIYYVTLGFGHSAWIVSMMASVADYFGTRRYATIMGLIQTLQMPVGVAAPIIAGHMFDVTGSYQTVFTVLGAVAASGAIWLFLIRRPVWDDVPVLHDV